MGQDLEIPGNKEVRLAWVEPEIKQLDVRETSSNPGRIIPECVAASSNVPKASASIRRI